MDNSLLEKLWEQFRKAIVPVEVEEFAINKTDEKSIWVTCFQSYVCGYLAGKEDSDE